MQTGGTYVDEESMVRVADECAYRALPPKECAIGVEDARAQPLRRVESLARHRAERATIHAPMSDPE